MAQTKVRSKQQIEVNSDVDFAGYKLINLATPTNANDAVTKAYADSIKQSLDVKDSCRVATTGTESYTISGGTVTDIAGTTIDGISVVIGDRILVKNAPLNTGAGSTTNTNQPANGIYRVTNVTTSISMTRADDANVSTEVTAGMFTFVTEGTSNADNGYVLITDGTIVINTTAMQFSQFSGAGQITAGNGLTKSGNALSVLADSSATIAVSSGGIGLATVSVGSTVTSQIRRFEVDSYGRISNATNATLSDIVTSIGSALTANTVFASPNGSAGSASFRALVAGDIPNLDTSKITTGTLGIARGGTGLGTTPSNGQLLIGNGTTYTLATLTQGTGITITNGSGTITIANAGVTTLTGTANQVTVSASTGAVTLSLPQNIHTGATPTFAGLTLTAGTVTVSTPYIAPTQTWNAGAVTFYGEIHNITDTASAVGSAFVEYRVGGTARYTVRKDGTITTGIWGGTAIGATVGGTGQTTYAVGDILFANTTTTLSRLAGVATGNVLISGGVSTAPSWGKVGLTTHVSGVLPIANGGTNVSTAPTNGQLLIGNGTGYTLANITGGTGISVTNGAGTISVAVNTTNILQKVDHVVRETPTGTVNGTNATFTLANTPVSGQEMVFVNGILMNVGATNDYTISTNTITFNSGAIPQTGDVVLVSYIK